MFHSHKEKWAVLCKRRVCDDNDNDDARQIAAICAKLLGVGRIPDPLGGGGCCAVYPKIVSMGLAARGWRAKRFRP